MSANNIWNIVAAFTVTLMTIVAVSLNEQHITVAVLVVVVGLFYLQTLNVGLLSIRARTSEKEANTDPLTGLNNRRGYGKETATYNRRQQHLYPNQHALMVLDIDNFKSINDTHGHDVGDEVIKDLANTLRSVMRTDRDVIARVGGEEFSVHVHGVTRMQARRLAVRLRRTVERRQGPVPYTISIGLVTDIYGSARQWGKAPKLADEMLYHAKQNGRNRVSWTEVN